MSKRVNNLREREVVRSLPKVVTRASEGDEMPVMEVRFSTFNEWYEINSAWEGKFLERTLPGAFKTTIAGNGQNVRCLFNHGFDPSVGDKVLGPIISLREEADSPVGLVQLLDTSYNADLIPGIEAGVYGSSMRFQVMADEWRDKPGVSALNPKGLPERDIKEVRLLEFGPVTFPANPGSTAGLRSLTDDFYLARARTLLTRRRALRNVERAFSPSAMDVSDGAYILSLLGDLMSDESDESDELALLQQAFNLVTQWMTSEVSDIGGPEDQAEAESETSPYFFYSQSKTGASRTSNARAARKGTRAEDAAVSPTAAPATSHPTGMLPSERRERLDSFLTRS